MRAFIRLYSTTRWFLLAIAVFVCYLCPLSSMMINFCVGFAVPLIMLGERNQFKATEYIKRSFSAIGLYAALALLAIGAMYFSQTVLGWFMDRRDPTLAGFSEAAAWLFAASTLLQLLSMIPALEELRQDTVDNHGDIDV